MPQEEVVGVYGYGDVTPYLKPFPQLNLAQIEALADLASNLGSKGQLDILQTHTTSGGTHLYVKHPRDGEFHIAASGNIVSLGGSFGA